MNWTVPNDIAWCGLDDSLLRNRTVEVDANWKTIADGFSETYHIQTLHPELHRCMDDVYAPQVVGVTPASPNRSMACRAADQGTALRRRCVGRVCYHAGRADGLAEDVAFLLTNGGRISRYPM